MNLRDFIKWLERERVVKNLTGKEEINYIDITLSTKENPPLLSVNQNGTINISDTI